MKSKVRTSAKKPAVVNSTAIPKGKAITKKLTKTETIRLLRESSSLTDKQVRNVFLHLQQLLHGSLMKQGCGEFVFPDLGIKVKRVQKPATKKRNGRNPFTGQEMVIPAKPAYQAIKVAAMKSLKEIL
jgi:nucleoid DNA-binding protein